MRAITTALLVFASLLPGVAAPRKLDIPHAGWEPIFFRAIDSLTKAAGWPRLRQADIPHDAIEIRVWVGFGLTPLEGFRLRRDGDRWIAHHVRQGFGDKRPLELHDVRPKDSWNKLWKKIEALGILSLPDSSTLPDEAIALDGISYVVEFSDERSYRTYQYGNPQYQKWREAKKSIEIVKALYEDLSETKSEPTPEGNRARKK